MSEKKIFAIGDIHGCYDSLKKLLNQLPLEASSMLCFLGDYIDRGPDSKKVIEFILKLKENYKVVCLRGNHENMFLDFLQRPGSIGSILFILNGGGQTLLSYSDDKNSMGFSIPKAHMDFLQSLPTYSVFEDYVFVHAGLPDLDLELALSEEYEEERLWIRKSFLESQYFWGKVVVHGHTPRSEVEVKDNRINLDTGCVYGNKLSALELNSKTLYQVAGQKPSSGIFYPKSLSIGFGNQRIAPRYSGSIQVFVDGYKESFETINYNEFGVLLRDVLSVPRLKQGLQIKGKIGDSLHTQIPFEGEVVRAEKSNQGYLYGVKLKFLEEKV